MTRDACFFITKCTQNEPAKGALHKVRHPPIMFFHHARILTGNRGQYIHLCGYGLINARGPLQEKRLLKALGLINITNR